MRAKRRVRSGADTLLTDPLPFGLSKRARCGLITNQTGILCSLRPTYDVLAERCTLAALFSPEHGVRGDAQAGAEILAGTDARTGLPAYSTYGRGKESAFRAMAELDAVFFDIQDIGSRYYTYPYTMAESMEACAEAGVPFIVLDRPPVIGCTPQGNILDPAFASFVGKYAVAARTGLTVGEFARYIHAVEGVGGALAVIPCRGVSRSMYYDECDLPFVPPSPNLPTVDCALVYVGTCLFEGTNVSEGRGTAKPFEQLGAPWLRTGELIEALNALPHAGCAYRETFFTPVSSKHCGVLCAGIQIHVLDRDAFHPFETGLRVLSAIRAQNPEFAFENGGKFAAQLFGSDALLAEEFDCEAYLAGLAAPLARYAERSRAFHLYE